MRCPIDGSESKIEMEHGAGVKGVVGWWVGAGDSCYPEKIRPSAGLEIGSGAISVRQKMIDR